MNLQDKWVQLEARERKAVVLGVCILAFGIVYGLIWRPLEQSVRVRTEQVQNMRSDLAWMRQAAAEIRALRGNNVKANAISGGSLLNVIDKSARQQGLDKSIVQLTPQGDGEVSVSLKQVNFTRLARWLGALQQQGVRIRTLSLIPSGVGQVRTSLTLNRAPAAST